MRAKAGCAVWLFLGLAVISIFLLPTGGGKSKASAGPPTCVQDIRVALTSMPEDSPSDGVAWDTIATMVDACPSYARAVAAKICGEEWNVDSASYEVCLQMYKKPFEASR